MSETMTLVPVSAEHATVARQAGYTLEAEVRRTEKDVLYRAVHRRLGRVAAFKFATRNTFHAHLEHEARVLVQLEGLGVVRLHDYGEAEDEPYLILDYPAGGTLETVVSLHGKFGMGKSLATGQAVARIVARVHGAGVVHGDLKPQSVWLSADATPVLADFGLATVASRPTNGSTATTSDIFALGQILYALLTGRAPIAQPTPPSQVDPRVSRSLDVIVLRCLAVHPADRFATAAAVAGALEHAFPLGHQEPFPYETLLAFHQGELSGAARAEVQRQLATDPRWRAHLDSVRYLKLEQLAARRDATDLESWQQEDAAFCAAVARTCGAVLQEVLDGTGGTVEGRTRDEWDLHLDRCVYCRRMHRSVQARLAAEAHQLPAGELLLRDWLLAPIYHDALKAQTRRLRRAQGLPDGEAGSGSSSASDTRIETRASDETKILPGDRPHKERQP